MEYFSEALKFENLYRAMKECCRNVRWKDSVVGYETNGIRNTIKLKHDILSGKYKISPYQRFYVYEPKKRQIIATRIRDRQWQRAMCNAGLYKEITKSFIYDNVACQNGKGATLNIKRMKVHLMRYYRKHKTDGWVLKCDIHHFFPSTPHDVAKAVIDKRVTDERIKAQVFAIIDSFGGDVGIGLGSQISQLIELAVLDDLDHYIKEQLRIKYYIRYMDDFILIHHDKEYIKYCLQQIKQRVEQLGLTLNDKTSIQPLKYGVKFCKWHYYILDSGRIVMKMEKSKYYRQVRKLKRIYAKEQKGEFPKGSAKESLKCWLANAKYGDTYNLRKRMLQQFGFLLRGD